METIYFEGGKSKEDALLRAKRPKRFAKDFGMSKCRFQGLLLML